MRDTLMAEMARNNPDELGQNIGRNLRNVMSHSAYTGGNIYYSVTLMVFGIMMKYLDDNSECLYLEIPEILRFDILTALMPDKVPYEKLADYLRYIQERMGIDRMGNYFYNELERCGLEEQGEFLQIIFSTLENYNFGDENGGRIALTAAAALIDYMSTFPQTGTQNMPLPILKLLDKISGIKSGMACYGFTTDSTLTLALLTAGKHCNVVAQTKNYYNETLCTMLLIMACDPNHGKLIRNQVEWMPIGLQNFEENFDRVYALPPFNSQINIRETLMQSGRSGEKFIAWWPEMLGCGEWIYARHLLKAIKSDGLGYIIFPLGMLSRMGSYMEVRERFIRENLIDAVIEFPAGTFYRTAVKVAVLVIKKCRNDKDVFMVNLGENAAKNLIQISRSMVEMFDAESVAEIVLKRKEVKSISRKITFKEILDNGCCLSPSAYICEDFDLDVLSDDFNRLIKDDGQLLDEFKESTNIFYEAMQKFINMKNEWEGLE